MQRRFRDTVFAGEFYHLPGSGRRSPRDPGGTREGRKVWTGTGSSAESSPYITTKITWTSLPHQHAGPTTFPYIRHYCALRPASWAAAVIRETRRAPPPLPLLAITPASSISGSHGSWAPRTSKLITRTTTRERPPHQPLITACPANASKTLGCCAPNGTSNGLDFFSTTYADALFLQGGTLGRQRTLDASRWGAAAIVAHITLRAQTGGGC